MLFLLHAIPEQREKAHWNKSFYKVASKTSLKIFKHYKLKPSFSIIKDEKEKAKAKTKAKDKVGVGDKSPPPSFNYLIKFDPI